MSTTEETLGRLTAIPKLLVLQNVPLSRYTRFELGGPARFLAASDQEEAIVTAVRTAREAGLEFVLIGAGTNVIAADSGFRGIVLRYTAERIRADGNRVRVDAGAELEQLVDFTVDRGLGGLETLAGIPGSAGAAVYGNAGAYGHSISEFVRSVRFFDGDQIRELGNEQCQFQYRESVFKNRKGWIIFSAELALNPSDAAALRKRVGEIRAVRDRKFPPAIPCAGSVFKNLWLRELPPQAAAAVPAGVVREGKVPAAYFLESVGAKGMRRGGMRVADFHANLIYKQGRGTARDLRDLIQELKTRVRDRFGMELVEEVQYVGFPELGNNRTKE